LINFSRLTVFLFALLGAVALAQTSVFTSPLPTGIRLDAVGSAVELGSMPLNVVPVLRGNKAVVVLGGWREQGIQVVDLKTRQVTQTLLQDSAFFGAAFSADGNALYVSGGTTDMLFISLFSPGKMARRTLGDEHSIGHHLDLSSVILRLTLFPPGYSFTRYETETPSRCLQPQICRSAGPVCFFILPVLETPDV
jgi:hypothetical protein